MALLKKFLLGVAGAASLGLVGNSFAEDFTPAYTDGFTAAADNLVTYINTKKFSLATVKLTGELSFPAENNTFTLDNEGKLNGIKIDSLSFNAHVTPFVGPESDVTVTVELEATVQGCSIVPKTGTYTITSFAPKNSALKNALLGDLRDDGDSMLTDLVDKVFKGTSYCK